jgi:membrane protease subunit (stomatin/prohibitin family)
MARGAIERECARVLLAIMSAQIHSRRRRPAMGLFDKIRGEFIDIIEWLDDTRDTIVYRFERYDNEIKMGAKLVVRESQVAIFVNEGRLADVFQPGTHTLETQNLPILSTLKGWKYGFSSPFKAEVYFVNTRQFTELKWGTQNPVIVRDPEFGPVRLRAFGTYAMRVVEPAAFLTSLVGTDPLFKTEEVSGYLRQLIVGRVATQLGKAQTSVLDMAAHQDTAGAALGAALSTELRAQGLEITKFIVENVSLPPEVEKALDQRSQMSVIGDLNRYTQYKSAEAIGDAAKNPGGAGDALGLGMGVAMGHRMAQALAGGAAAPTGAAPPPLPTAPSFYVGIDGQQQGPFDLSQLRVLAQQGKLIATTLVWSAGMAAWTAASQVPDVAAVLPQGPPPLPK